MSDCRHKASTTTHSYATALGSVPPAERLATAIYKTASKSSDQVALVLNAGTPDRHPITYGELAHRLSVIERQLGPTDLPGIVLIDANLDSLILTAAACGRHRISLAILSNDSAILADRLSGWLRLDDALLPNTRQAVTNESDEIIPRLPPRDVSIATSGTTGPPKLIGHSWNKVIAAVRFSMRWHERTWALTYDSAKWAGLQVWLQAILTAGRTVIPASHDPDVVARAIVDEHVSILPTTPTLMRRLLVSADPAVLRLARLSRITLGGETTDPYLLERTSLSFPHSKVTHVYATSELGEVFHVTDGQAGFPVEWADRPLPSGAQISVDVDGELIVQTSSMPAAVRTGDLVIRLNNRFHFVGRRHDVINVGGAKVFPEQVESVICSVSGVEDAQVYGILNAVTGCIVASEIVLAEPLAHGTTPERVRAEVFATCKTRLPPHAVPRLLVTKRRLTLPPVTVMDKPIHDA